jgi:Na+/proline symporter
MPRRVRVKGMQGVDATVVVTVVQGKVWLSVSPPFTWEAIMEPGKVDELMHVLELAQEEAKQMAATPWRPT